jgi:hypothetical protein
MLDGHAKCSVACAGKEYGHLRRTAFCGQSQRSRERSAKGVRSRDREGSNLTVGINISVAYAIVSCVKKDASRRAVVDQIFVMLLA